MFHAIWGYTYTKILSVASLKLTFSPVFYLATIRAVSWESLQTEIWLHGYWSH